MLVSNSLPRTLERGNQLYFEAHRKSPSRYRWEIRVTAEKSYRACDDEFRTHAFGPVPIHVVALQLQPLLLRVSQLSLIKRNAYPLQPDRVSAIGIHLTQVTPPGSVRTHERGGGLSQGSRSLPLSLSDFRLRFLHLSASRVMSADIHKPCEPLKGGPPSLLSGQQWPR
jgi:hypothetical protein